MGTIDTILIILALVCFLIDAFRLLEDRPVNFTALGLALWVLTVLVPHNA